MIGNSVEILGIKITGTKLIEVLKEVKEFVAGSRVKKGELVIFTPNAEFLVEARENPEFGKILNQADINIPDGFGLILASRILGSLIKERVSGADLVERLLEMGNELCVVGCGSGVGSGGEDGRQNKQWIVGIAGARRGDQKEAEELVKRLQNKYPNIKFVNIGVHIRENLPVIRANQFQIVLACHGMIKQESWIIENKDKIQASVFIGVGGSLDFLTGFTKRAPVWMRNLGLEWLWRGLQKLGHWRRIWKAIAIFGWLIIKEKFKN